NLADLEWVTQYVMDRGAELLQIHPLEEAGRAAEELVGSRPDRRERDMACIVSELVRRKTAGTVKIQCDFASKSLLRDYPNRVVPPYDGDAANQQLSNLASPLVVEWDGTVVPVQFGFARSFELGNIKTESLGRMAQRWRRLGFPVFRNLCQDVQDLTVSAEFPEIFNWNEVICQAAAKSRLAVKLAG
ncbi:MAG: SPASM domain-containing protein, partial [Xanthomonadales bacterium]|nr:SPASM domain-containing protein [Xanthomonadales bacterium]